MGLSPFKLRSNLHLDRARRQYTSYRCECRLMQHFCVVSVIWRIDRPPRKWDSRHANLMWPGNFAKSYFQALNLLLTADGLIGSSCAVTGDVKNSKRRQIQNQIQRGDSTYDKIRVRWQFTGNFGKKRCFFIVSCTSKLYSCFPH